MSYYTLQEAADILTSHGHTMSASKLIREGTYGKVIIAVSLNIGRRRWSSTKYFRLSAAKRLTIDALKGLPESDVEFDSEQLDFLQRLHDEVIDAPEFNRMSTASQVHELMKPNGVADNLLREMSHVEVCGLYIVPPINLIDFDTKGKSYLERVFSLDWRDTCDPFEHVTSDMLRITDYHLVTYEKTLDQTSKPTPANDKASGGDEKNKKDKKNKPIKRLISNERETTELLVLIYRMFNHYGIKTGDEFGQLSTKEAWGHIFAGNFKSDLIKNLEGTRKEAYIELNGGEQVDYETFARTYNRRFK